MEWEIKAKTCSFTSLLLLCFMTETKGRNASSCNTPSHYNFVTDWKTHMSNRVFKLTDPALSFTFGKIRIEKSKQFMKKIPKRTKVVLLEPWQLCVSERIATSSAKLPIIIGNMTHWYAFPFLAGTMPRPYAVYQGSTRINSGPCCKLQAAEIKEE